jgi:carboxyl-terminal processing protease
MRKRSTKAEFTALFLFLVTATLVLTNGFSSRIFAQGQDREVFRSVEPIGQVLGEILDNYVYEPDLDKAVEGALEGIMRTLDRNSSYIRPEGFRAMREDTEGEFEGIGVNITFEESNVVVSYPVPEGPAAKAGVRSGDYIVAVEDVPLTEMSIEGMLVSEMIAQPDGATDVMARLILEEVSSRIKGPRGTVVRVTVSRAIPDSEARQNIDLKIERGMIPLQSVVEARLLDDRIGYIRIKDFKKNTAEDLRREVESLLDQSMRALVLDLRWNPGGLLNSSREVCELFLPKNSLVVSTRGREGEGRKSAEDMELYTEKHPILPETMPMILLVSELSASSSEIVTGALQYYQRAIVVGEKTFGKGSVQTIIPLSRPQGAALRLTTALYYTPAGVTIDEHGILPDVDVPMAIEMQRELNLQMMQSIEGDPANQNRQDHGAVTGNTGEGAIQDSVLERAVQILREDTVWENILSKYHRDVRETQVAAANKEARAH